MVKNQHDVRQKYELMYHETEALSSLFDLFSCDTLQTRFMNVISNGSFAFSGAYFLSHSLSWTNNKENSGVYDSKVWMPEDPRSAKANGRYVTEG